MNCKECGGKVSTIAKACPGCGAEYDFAAHASTESAHITIEIKFQCPHCDAQELLADSSLSGQALECPVCGKSVMVPEYQPTKAIIPVAELVKVKTDSDEGFKCHVCNQAIAKGERCNQCFPATSGPYKSLSEHFSNEGEPGWKPDLKGGYRLTPRRETGQGSTEHRDDEPSNAAAVQSVVKAASFMRGLAIFCMIASPLLVLYQPLKGVRAQQAGLSQVQEDTYMIYLGGQMVQFGILFLVNIFIFIGANKMKKRQSYGLAMAASILCLLCDWPFMCLGLVSGIWSIVVLCKSEVKAEFT